MNLDNASISGSNIGHTLRSDPCMNSHSTKINCKNTLWLFGGKQKGNGACLAASSSIKNGIVTVLHELQKRQVLNNKLQSSLFCGTSQALTLNHSHIRQGTAEFSVGARSWALGKGSTCQVGERGIQVHMRTYGTTRYTIHTS